jgi:uncharacterized membrane protein
MLLLLAFLLGVVAGLRSMTAPAAASWAARLAWINLQSTPLAFLGSPIATGVLTFFAAGELVGDKLPFTPSRLSAAPLAARLVMGGLCGAVVFASHGASLLIGGVAGALGGLAGAFLGYHARHALVTTFHVPDLVVALVEDLVAIGGALFLVSRI